MCSKLLSHSAVFIGLNKCSLAHEKSHACQFTLSARALHFSNRLAVKVQTEWLWVSDWFQSPYLGSYALSIAQPIRKRLASDDTTMAHLRTCVVYKKEYYNSSIFPPSPVALILCSISCLTKNLPSLSFSYLSHVSKKIKRRAPH